MRIYVDIDISWKSLKCWAKDRISRYRRRRDPMPALTFGELVEITNQYFKKEPMAKYFGKSHLVEMMLKRTEGNISCPLRSAK